MAQIFSSVSQRLHNFKEQVDDELVLIIFLKDFPFSSFVVSFVRRMDHRKTLRKLMKHGGNLREPQKYFK